MMTYKRPDVIQALESAWNREAAETSLDRWLSVCKKEKWNTIPENLPLLISLFGASWYFTRFVFFQGKKITHYFDDDKIPDFSLNRINFLINDSLSGDTLDEKLESIRLVKNEIMLQIFLCDLGDKLSQSEIEFALTNLAESCLCMCIKLFDSEQDTEVWNQISILAMGRMAGHEMNYGSDLDLIFLYAGGESNTAEHVMRQSQNLMRKISHLSPNGTLYEIDMRLRPHGSSGTLVTSVEYFTDYHSKDREIWERQMMTRCRSVYDHENLADDSLNKINEYIYSKYDQIQLKKEIINMRKLVEEELGNPNNRYEIKRGIGGIMDIDFITHYLQLNHGSEFPVLHTPSTRIALEQLCKCNIINIDTSSDLINAYNYLKKIEGHLRAYDMKSINVFPRDPEGVIPLSRAMGFVSNNQINAAKEFLKEYKSVIKKVRSYFENIIGKF